MKKKKLNRAFALPMVLMFLVLLSVMGIGFYSSAGNKMEEAFYFKEGAQYKQSFSSAIESTKRSLMVALGGLQIETGSFSEVLNEIATNSEITPVQRSILFFNETILPHLASQAGITAANLGVWESDSNKYVSHWFRSLEIRTLELKYTFSALPVRFTNSPAYFGYEFEWLIEARTSPDPSAVKAPAGFNYLKASETNIISADYRPAPFSQWAIFRQTSQAGYSGATLWFVGPTNTTAGEIIDGPVYLGDPAIAPVLAGHVIFRDRLDTVTNTQYSTATGFSGSPELHEYNRGVAPVAIPENYFALERVALGETGEFSSINQSELSNLEYRTLAFYSANRDSLPPLDLGQDAPLPQGVYIPYQVVGGQQRLKGGIFAQGAVQQMRLRVLADRSASEHSAQFISAGFYSDCKLQMVQLQNTTERVSVYSTDRSCAEGAKTLIVTEFVGNSEPAATLFYGQPGGVLYVNGPVDALGQTQRSDRALMADRQLTIAANGNIKIDKDLTYEDANFVQVAPNGTILSIPALDPLQANVQSEIEEESKTILGLISTSGRVFLKCQTTTCADPILDAPVNINLHAAIFAASSSNITCPAPSNSGMSGCGFGFEGMLNVPSQNVANKGMIKFLGAMTEYRNFAVGLGSEGYKRRYRFDTRLRTLTPPFFPVSDVTNASVNITSMQSLQFGENSTDETESQN